MPKVNEQKHLGLIFDLKLSFERHLNEKIIKAKKGIGIIKYLSKFLPLQTPDQMFKSLVRSHLDYCDIISHIPALYSQTNLPCCHCYYWYMAWFKQIKTLRGTGMGNPI